MNSNVPRPFLRHGPRSRKVTSSRPLEIDVDRPAEHIEKISRACLFVPRDPTNGDTARVPPLKISLRPFSLRTHVRRKNARAKLGRARTGSDFSSDTTGVPPNMARECVGGILRRLEKCRSECITGIQGLRRVFPIERSCFNYIFFFLNNFINFPSYSGKTCVFAWQRERAPNNSMTTDR